MNQEHYQNANTQPYDVKYISRCLMRNALFILMFACLAGVFSYIFLDHYKKDTYTASVNLYVIPRDNAGIKFILPESVQPYPMRQCSEQRYDERADKKGEECG